MSVAVRLWLVLTMTALLGMAVLPANHRAETDRTEGSQEEEAALIAELNVWEERAIAERYEFFQSLDILRDIAPEKESAREEEAK